MPSREELLQSIRPGMKLDKVFFLRIYGYSITTPEFAGKALEKLERIYILYAQQGETHPGAQYKAIVDEYETLDRQRMKEAGEWYAKQLNDRWERQKRGEKIRAQKKDQILKDLEKMSDGELLKLWQKRRQQSQEAF